MIRPPRALRTRLLLAIVVAVGVALAAMTTIFNVLVARNLSRDADEVVHARAEAERSAITVRDGRIVPAPERGLSLETLAWVFQGGTALQAPRSDPDLNAAAHALAVGPKRTIEVESEEVRLYSVPVIWRGRRIGTVVAGVSLSPYNSTRVTALLGSAGLATAALVAVTIAAALMLRAALRPVARMTADAAAWSERDLDKRFALGPPHDEITQLASTLDGLLDRLAAGLRRERRLTAEVSHELRTPLAQVRAEIDLALRRERDPAAYRRALEAVRGGSDRLSATVDTLLATARQEASLPRGTSDAHVAASRVADACAPVAAARGVSLVVEAPAARARAGVESEVIERILQPVVENACQFARREVRIAIGDDGGAVSVEVADDGPGVGEGEREEIFEPGVRGAAASSRPEGSGLGLTLARRLARAAGGEVEARADGAAGARFEVRLPAA